MAEFKCHNCGNEFEKFCDNVTDTIDVMCQGCRSHWVELVLKKQPKPIFPTLPYTDPFNIPINPPIYWSPYGTWCSMDINKEIIEIRTS